jgi:hypothetical protein
MLRRLLLAVFVIAACASASAQEKGTELRIEFADPSTPAIVLDQAALARLPAVKQDVAFMTSKGEERYHYRGALLWGVFADWAGGLKGHHEELAHTFMVTGSDGYAIAFSFGEIAPDFGNRAIMLATEVDGKPLPDGQAFRLVVPGDKRGARSVKDVVRIDVR